MGHNILIVGGTGVISYAVVLEAVKQGFNVTCINRGISKTQQLPSSVEVILADYRCKDTIEKKLENRFFDAVIDVLCYTESDIDYSFSIFKTKCKQYIFFSSCAVYNKGKGDYFCTENSELINPLWNYSINKVKCEEKLKTLIASCEKDIKYTIIRPAVTYGNTRIPYGLTPTYGYHGTIIQRIIHHKPIIIWDEGKNISTITRVEDFAIGLVGLLANPKAYNETFHIVGDERYTWKEVIDTLGEIIGVKPIYFNLPKETLAREIPNKSGELLGGRGIDQLLDNTKIKTVVPNFKTTISLKDGLKMTYEYYLKNHYLKGIDFYFDGEWDRIVKKYQKNDRYNIKYIDYLKDKLLKNKLKYIYARHKDNPIIRLIALIKK
ncbi:NAD-dependent epimerase/dehydratase family protein [uncultured Bacteroides sp.]|uniref:NAD-dependent epimerase/dehydratase family protein n=1 Tax=uncultured Bacteroides sp. TaxID=162156 RepID=UPI00262D4708|nr:NAD-dependent epimerase/dehydratase family protein [uncultured Bacteroides sp.]